MRLDHLLSMETMGCFHEYPGVGIDESVRNLYGDFCCSIFGDQRSSKKRPFITRGCSSAGRAPALQAGGHGFDSHHLHQPMKVGNPKSDLTETDPMTDKGYDGRIETK